MLKERYYYSRDYKIYDVPCLANNKGEIIGVDTASAKVSYNVPRVTICGIWNTEDNTLTFGVARCSKKDPFKKEIGRKYAYKRAIESPYTRIKIPAALYISDAFMTYAKQIEEEIMGMEYPIKLNG